MWSIDKKDSLKVSILQPNINAGIKYDNDKINFIKQKYLSLLSDNITNKTIILPETAIPIIYERDKNFYNSMLEFDDTNIISGIFHYEASQNKIYNSMLVLNKNEKFYNKRHLVPFGEYTPLKKFFSYIAKKLNIPMSNLSHGNLNQKPFLVKKSGISGQTTQQNHSVWAFKNSKYIGLFDVDEYINIQHETNIEDFFNNSNQRI